MRSNTPPSKAISRPAPRKSICTRCRAASSPICASRRAGLGSRRAGTRWRKAYRDANDLFGDIVKVTPSSKVVGDMALMMVSQNLDAGRCARSRPRDRLPDLGRRYAAPAISASRRAAGRKALQAKALKGEKPIDGRPGALLPPTDLGGARVAAEKACGRQLSDDDLASYLMYPKVFTEFCATVRRYRPGLGAADAGVLLRHAAGRRDRHRDRAGQDARLAVGDDRRDRRGGQGQGLLRTERPAAHHPRAEQVGGGDGDRAAQGRGGQ